MFIKSIAGLVGYTPPAQNTPKSEAPGAIVSQTPEGEDQAQNGPVDNGSATTTRPVRPVAPGTAANATALIAVSEEKTESADEVESRRDAIAMQEKQRAGAVAAGLGGAVSAQLSELGLGPVASGDSSSQRSMALYAKQETAGSRVSQLLRAA